MSANPTLPPSSVVEILKSSAKDLGATGWDPLYGSGLVDAGRAVSLAAGSVGSDVLAPSVAFLSPDNGSAVAGPFNVSVAAADNVGVYSIDLFVDGSFFGTVFSNNGSWNMDLSGLPLGTHLLMAVATDTSGNASSTSIAVDYVEDAVAPTIRIVTPTDGSIRGNVSITTQATDNVGVSRVELFIDGKLVSSSTTAPFSFSWNTNKASSGSHTLQCVAYDASSNAGPSQMVTVRIGK